MIQREEGVLERYIKLNKIKILFSLEEEKPR